jgi:hypothetical protein
MRSREQQQCWISAGLTPLLEGRVISLSESVATVELDVPAAVPEQCNLLFTADGKVGRRCALVRQSGSEVVLSIKGRIGPADSGESGDDSSRFVKI